MAHGKRWLNSSLMVSLMRNQGAFWDAVPGERLPGMASADDIAKAEREYRARLTLEQVNTRRLSCHPDAHIEPFVHVEVDRWGQHWFYTARMLANRAARR